MYRCFGCDVPAEHGHDHNCPIMEDSMLWWDDEEVKINIASGEDVLCS